MSNGGQKRTIQYGCGFILKGHPTEVNKKHVRHLRFCSQCSECLPKKLEDFSTSNGLINGWDGLSRKGDIINTKSVSLTRDGNTTNILTNAKGNTYERSLDPISSVILGEEDTSNKEGIISMITEIRELLRNSAHYQHIQRFDKYTEEKMLSMTRAQLEIINNLFMESLSNNQISVV